MTQDGPSIDAVRKKILWRATHRGMRELDLVVGGFAKRNVRAMPADALAAFDRLLDIPDQSMLAWLTGVASVPPEHDTPLLHDILSFKP